MERSILLTISIVFALVLLVVSPVVGAGDPATIAIQSGNSQSATAGTAVTTPPSVLVTDSDGEKVIGVTVIFSVSSGGGSISSGNATTNENGVATIGSWTLGTTAGSNILSAGYGSLTPVTFTATGTAGAATQMAKNAGDAQTAPVGTAVSTAPSVIVKDTNNNPVSGITVNFAAGSGGSVTGDPAVTNAQGIATVGSWTLGPNAGSNSLVATSGSLTAVTFTATGTAVLAPTISSISPSSTYNTSSITPTITGNYFSTTGVPEVRLYKEGMTNISATGITVASGGQSITCTFATTGKQAGLWDVIVINPDGQSAVLTSGFEIKSSSSDLTLSSITPASAVANTTVSITNLAGTNFAASPDVYLKRSGYNDIPGTFTYSSTTQLTGSFNLTNRVPGSYQVCVVKSGSDPVCGLTFSIISMVTTNGSIYFTSSPAGAVVYVDTVEKGNTPFTLSNVPPGSYNIKMQRASYLDWADRIDVTSGNETTVSATLTYAETATSAATASTTAPTIVITTATLPPTTIRTVPTAWVEPTFTTEESPLEIVVVVGAIALGMIVLRRRK